MAGRRREYANVEIIDLEYQGYGIAKPDGKVLFVEDTLPGEVVDARVIRNKRDYAFATPTAFHSLSDERIEPFCGHFHACGGCKWQYLPYHRQLAYKQYFLRQILERIARLEEPDIDPIIGCESDRYYRNKLDFSFTESRWLDSSEVQSGENFDRRGVGFHVRRRFDRVLDVEHCWLQPEPSNEIRNALRDFAMRENIPFFDPVSNQGFLRSLVIRTSLFGETMVMVVFARDEEEPRRRVMEFLAVEFPQITSLAFMINTTKNDSTLPHPAHIYRGADHIREKMGDRVLRIHPKSFYQTNPAQAVRLYEVAAEMAALTGTETVYDLYCGIGSIGLFVAERAGRVVGIDNVPEAIENARENAEANDAASCTFLHGDVRDLLNNAFVAEHGRPDVVILDPPRAGMHPQVLKTLIEVSPPHIVYVSCNPATQARDLQELSESYEVGRIQPVDMFPQTYHIENVVDLRRRAD
ncbi:MAG: 23S rRNA (uracil(1939)-C(5))-methyltransferase RlmD [Spirochaetaceae bacterium]